MREKGPSLDSNTAKKKDLRHSDKSLADLTGSGAITLTEETGGARQQMTARSQTNQKTGERVGGRL